MLMEEGDRVFTTAPRSPAARLPAQVDAQAESPAAEQELSPAEAVAVFTLSEATLRRLLAAGSIPARKVNGRRGREWRIPASALEEAGYTRRATATEPEQVAHPEARRLREALASERARASQLDCQLGYALLTIGRLRGRLRAAGIDPDELFGADLAGECNEGAGQAPPADEPPSRGVKARYGL